MIDATRSVVGAAGFLGAAFFFAPVPVPDATRRAAEGFALAFALVPAVVFPLGREPAALRGLRVCVVTQATYPVAAGKSRRRRARLSAYPQSAFRSGSSTAIITSCTRSSIIPNANHTGA